MVLGGRGDRQKCILHEGGEQAVRSAVLIPTGCCTGAQGGLRFYIYVDPYELGYISAGLGVRKREQGSVPSRSVLSFPSLLATSLPRRRPLHSG